jgi:predicted nucleotide-binding protein
MAKKTPAKKRGPKKGGPGPQKECPGCHHMSHTATSACDNCGHLFRKTEKSNGPAAATFDTDRSAYRFIIKMGGVEKAKRAVAEARENDLLVFLIAQGSISAAKQAIDRVAKEIETVPF